MNLSRNKQLFHIHVFKNVAAHKILFYHTSYGFPWWVYFLQIHIFRQLGYEVVVYDYANQVLENDDPFILPKVVEDVLDDMHKRVDAYRKRGDVKFHGIGNSLGSYFIYNFALRNHLSAMMLNSGGSIADIVYFHHHQPWLQTQAAYKKLGYDKTKVKKLWADYDSPQLGKNILADRVLIALSHADKTIPPSSSAALAEAIQASGKHVIVEYNSLPHARSVVWNSWHIRKIYRFLNSHDSTGI